MGTDAAIQNIPKAGSAPNGDTIHVPRSIRTTNTAHFQQLPTQEKCHRARD